MIIPAYRAGFSAEIAPGEVTLRTRKRCYLVAFAVQCHPFGYRAGDGERRRWTFVQFGSKTLWLRRP